MCCCCCFCCYCFCIGLGCPISRLWWRNQQLRLLFSNQRSTYVFSQFDRMGLV